MKINIFPDYEKLSQKTAAFIVDAVNQKPDGLYCLPAGHTSLGTFQCLIETAAKGQVDFHRCQWVSLDEWVDLPVPDGSCKHFLMQHFFEPLQIKPSQITFFDGKAADLKAECDRIDDFIKQNGPIDLMLLGLGMNGHLGLNEPGSSSDSSSHVVMLDGVTKVIGQKYFQKPVVLEKGITLGLSQIMLTRTVLLQVSGSNKASIVRNLVENVVSKELPASILKLHQQSLLFLDRAAASGLS